MKLITGVKMSKKSWPKTVADEIEKKKQNRLKKIVDRKFWDQQKCLKSYKDKIKKRTIRN